jgi:hypothetical protein
MHPFKLTFWESRKETKHLRHTLQIFEFDLAEPGQISTTSNVFIATPLHLCIYMCIDRRLRFV